MKLRLRNSSGGDTLRIELQQNSTLQNLKESLSATISFPSDSISLSLNKREEISGNPTDSLETLGIKGGDLIFFSRHANSFTCNNPKHEREEMNNNPNTMKKPSPQSSSSDIEMPDANPNPNPNVSSSIPEDPNPDSDDPNPSTEIGRASNVPWNLARLLSSGDFQRNDGGDSYRFTLLAVHAAMLEVGFLGFHPDKGFTHFTHQLPDGWTQKPVVRVFYTLSQILNEDGKTPDSPEHVSIQFYRLQDFLVVYGSLKGCKSYRLSIGADEFSPALNYVLNENDENFVRSGAEKLYELWRIAKDRLVLPLLSDMCERAGLFAPPSLIMLPSEIKIMILGRLCADDVARMACVCQEFKFLCNNEEMWKKYFEETFRGERPFDVRRWKDAFARRWSQRKQMQQRKEMQQWIQRKEMQQRRVAMERIHWLNSPLAWRHMHNPLSRSFPRIIGGPYDASPGAGFGNGSPWIQGPLGGGAAFSSGRRPGRTLCDLSGLSGDP